MRELEPVTKRRFRCDFCENPKTYYTEKGCLKHESICYENPNRDCDTCGNDGWVDEVSGFGTTDLRKCYSCQYAEERGGKSYIGTN